MISARFKVAALGVVAGLLLGLAAPLLAERHPLCAAQKHGCGATTRLVKCCCPDGAHRPADSAPAPAKVEIARPIATTAAVVVIDVPAAAGLARNTIQSSPPHFAVLDRQALFSSFLI